MGAELNGRLLLMKQEFESVGVKLDGLTWQRIDKHMQQYTKECVIASLEKASKLGVCYFYENGKKIEYVHKPLITSQENIVLL